MSEATSPGWSSTSRRHAYDPPHRSGGPDVSTEWAERRSSSSPAARSASVRRSPRRSAVRGAFVVTLDPVVALDGVTPVAAPESEPTTAERIVAAGGAARASSTSVTDEDAVRCPVRGARRGVRCARRGRQRRRHQPSDRFRVGHRRRLGRRAQRPPRRLPQRAAVALPIMAAAGHGRILGVTSGSGWRAADAGAYSCAKRAVAALDLADRSGRAPAASPSTRSPQSPRPGWWPAALSRQAGGRQRRPGSRAASGGVALGAVPPPEHLGPIGAYLASDEFSWCTGQVMFSDGLGGVGGHRRRTSSKCARTVDVTSFPHVLETLVPVAFAPAEAAQVSERRRRAPLRTRSSTSRRPTVGTGADRGAAA